MTKIVHDYPPNFRDILARFPGARRSSVIFAYAPDIFAPGGKVPPEIVAHEEVHIARQLDIGVDLWWSRYLSEAPFRYGEELLAHRAEYRHMIEGDDSRAMRRRALKIVAQKLVHPLYDYKGRFSITTAIEDLRA